MEKKHNQIEILLKLGYLSQENLKDLSAKDDQGKIDELITKEILTKDIVGNAIAENYKLKYINLSKNTPSTEIVKKLPKGFAQRYKAVLTNIDKAKAIVATSHPDKSNTIIRELKNVLKVKNIEILYAFEQDIEEIQNIYRDPLQNRITEIINSNETIATNLFNELVNEAYEMKSSDIHIEPLSNKVVLRFRIDGILRVVGELTPDIYSNLLNRVKVLANLRIDQHFEAQDGAIRIDIDDIGLDLRVSIVPTVNGQNIVIRILSSYIKNLGLKDLGLNELDEILLTEASKKPYGMIITAGPTGSGKTTTLYSILKLLQKPEVNITTIEDPVEYKIDGINQIQVNTLTNLTFAKGLRSIVRQDPNIILVGEIRDRETVEISINAALTGHLLLSTFHSNDAYSVIPRLLDMGSEPFLLSSTLSLIVAQRLARKVCPNCKKSYEIKSKDLEKVLPSLKQVTKDNDITLFKGEGCNTCNNTGYKGRIGIFEILSIDNDFKELIIKSPSSLDIKKLALKKGMRTFEIDGIEKMLVGEISQEELQRVIMIEQTAHGKREGK